MGAWIETGKSLNPYRRSFVAPYVGAWIETNPSRHTFANGRVAPYVGAWIETLNRVFHSLRLLSHPTWVRGLKPKRVRGRYVDDLSHPTWVRGLKLQVFHLL